MEIVKNFITFNKSEGGKVSIVRNENGEEVGFEVSGLVTTFEVKNENGYIFTADSYDKAVETYFERNNFNIPLCLLHDDEDIRNICGFVKSMTKTENGVEMVGFVPRSAYYYNLIKNYIESGILQGFSNAGFIADGEQTEDGLKIKEFQLLHIALVCSPADTTAKFKVANTKFEGFNTEKEVKKIDIDDLMLSL